MNNCSFTLTPAYCLFNGIGIWEQEDSFIRFMIEHPEDEILKERLKRAFNNHIKNINEIKQGKNQLYSLPIVEFKKATRTQIREYVSSLYESEYKNDDENSLEKNEKSLKVTKINESKKEEAAAVLLLDKILTEGRKSNATDIHIEERAIRFRVNGQLQKQMSVSGKRYKELIQRIKLLSGMNVLEKRKNQDGHFVYGERNPLFIRTSSVCLVNDEYEGYESVVLRLLDTSRIPLAIENLGFNENQLERISDLEALPNGLILVCGPTGSGKSTTVASVLVELQKKYNAQLKIISVEDPPEYVIPGVSQIKVENSKKNFNETLNHIFRLDPDVIMIGEIRDEESANAALKASLTGHLVFATLHTGSVGEAILRLENLGLKRNLICSVIKGVICQELSFVGKEMKLYADVGIPKENFTSKIKKEMGEEEIESLFIHETNYGEVLSKTLEIFEKRDFQLSLKETRESLRGRRNKKVWRKNKGNAYAKVQKNTKVY